MANRPPCKHLDHDFDPRHDACSKCGMTRERWRALDVSSAAATPTATPTATQSDEHSAFEAHFPKPNHIERTDDGYRVADRIGSLQQSDAWRYIDRWIGWKAARAQAIYQIGAPGIAGHQVVWWDVPQEEYEREKAAGYMRTGIVYRKGE